MIWVLLSVGALNALAPVLVIVILIGAAAGLTRGFSFLDLFGAGKLVGLTSGAKSAKGALGTRSLYSKSLAGRGWPDKPKVGAPRGARAAPGSAAPPPGAGSSGPTGSAAVIGGAASAAGGRRATSTAPSGSSSRGAGSSGSAGSAAMIGGAASGTTAPTQKSYVEAMKAKGYLEYRHTNREGKTRRYALRVDEKGRIIAGRGRMYKRLGKAVAMDVLSGHSSIKRQALSRTVAHAVPLSKAAAASTKALFKSTSKSMKIAGKFAVHSAKNPYLAYRFNKRLGYKMKKGIVAHHILSDTGRFAYLRHVPAMFASYRATRGNTRARTATTRYDLFGKHRAPIFGDDKKGVPNPEGRWIWRKNADKTWSLMYAGRPVEPAAQPEKPPEPQEQPDKPLKIPASSSNPNEELISTVMGLRNLEGAINARGSGPRLKGNAERIKELIQNGADPHYKDKNGQTAMHYAAANNDPAAIGLLKDGGWSADEKDNTGETPLHVAAKNNNIEAIRALRSAGADINITDANNLTPAQLAAKSNAGKAAEELSK